MTLGTGTPRTMQSRNMMVQDLKTRVARAEYHVDCRAVAEAFLARHSRCWKPASLRSPRPSVSTSSEGPRTIRPTRDSDGSSAGPQASSS